MSIEVSKSGLWSSIQDKGRFGFADYGVPASGAMDKYAANFANLILANPEEAAVLEVTLAGPKLLFHISCAVALAGLEAEILLNANRVSINEAFYVKKGDMLEIKKVTKGSRVYLAVKGGFKTEKVMESRSMFDGITKNNKIDKGDLLPVNTYNKTFSEKNSLVHYKNELYNTEIEVDPGPELNLLSEPTRKLLFEKSFTLSPDSNRMAFVLNETLKNELPNILTCPVLPGTVQLTPSGKIVVLMRDCQVSGGYPRVLQLKENSINKLSQINGGEKFVFRMLCSTDNK